MKKVYRGIRNFLLILTVALQIVTRMFSGFGDWYVENIYPSLVQTVGGLFSPIPFSVTEILFYGLIIFIIYSIVKCGLKRSFSYFKYKLEQLSCIIVCLFFLYTIGCGINYYRTSFSDVEGYVVETHSLEELKQLCWLLVGQVNEAVAEVSFDEEGVLVLNQAAALNEARQAMTTLGVEAESLSGYYPMPKYLFNSRFLSLQKLTGIYSPFTIEANVNQEMPTINIPFTLCHELSHLKGFMREDEANFIAYLACMASESHQFQYSGSIMAFTYSMNALYRTGDIEGYWEIRGLLDERAEKDLLHDSLYWRQYSGKISETANKINDTYLKVNSQKDGVNSYGRIVDLLLAHYKDER